ncbi:MAG: diaminopimelate epimerase [Myxococcota bacterium]
MDKYGKAFKYHGLGNDFVLFDAIKSKRLISPEDARFICDRHFGVGADGVLTLLPSDKADFYMHIYNSDGSVAEMCGNGIRCAVKHYIDLYKRGNKGNEVRVETKSGIQVCNYIIKNGEVRSVTVNMGSPILLPEKIPVRSSSNLLKIKKGHGVIAGMAVSMGNPHFVSFGRYQGEDILEWGPYIERHRLFPRYTNVELVRIKSKQEADVFVWERGVGITLACGSGSCAVAVAGVKMGLLKANAFLKIRLPGGILNIKYDTERDIVLMNGEARRVFRIEF